MNISQKSQKALEYQEVLTELSEYAKTEQSKQLCLDLTPFVRTKDIQRELIYTREAKNILDFGDDIPVDNIQNFRELRERNEYYTEKELLDIAKSLRVFRLVKNYLKENSEGISQLITLADGLYADKTFEDKIFDTFDENCAVRQDANDDLNGLYSSLKDTETQ